MVSDQPLTNICVKGGWVDRMPILTLVEDTCPFGDTVGNEHRRCFFDYAAVWEPGALDTKELLDLLDGKDGPCQTS